MIPETLSKIESAIKKINQLDHKKKSEILTLLHDLKSEIQNLSDTHEAHAESIAGFTEMATHEAKRNQQDLSLLNHAVDGMISSVKGFEVSHPKLVDTVNRICQLLSDIGI